MQKKKTNSQSIFTDFFLIFNFFKANLFYEWQNITIILTEIRYLSDHKPLFSVASLYSGLSNCKTSTKPQAVVCGSLFIECFRSTRLLRTNRSGHDFAKASFKLNHFNVHYLSIFNFNS